MTCEDYLQDPETNAAHLESCASCRAIAEELSAEIDAQPRAIAIDALPLAPWEGAQHRTWPLVAAGVVSVLILAVILFIAAGISSVNGVAQALFSAIPPINGLLKLFRHTGAAIGGPTVAILFVVVNTILFLLLRRSPRGIDV